MSAQFIPSIGTYTLMASIKSCQLLVMLICMNLLVRS